MTEHAELVARLGVKCRTGKFANEVADLQTRGDTILVNEGDYWALVLAAREAATAIETLERERDEARARIDKQSDYSIHLQRIIEAVCHGRELREDSADLVHHNMVLHLIPHYRGLTAEQDFRDYHEGVVSGLIAKLQAAEAKVAKLVAGEITDAQGIAWFERSFGVPLGDMPGRLDVEAMRARAEDSP